MDVDPPPGKCPVPLPASSPADKRAKILPDDRLSTFNDKLNKLSLRNQWQNRLEVAKDDEIEGVIVNLTHESVLDIVDGFNEAELSQWEAGVRKGVETNNWMDLLAHPILKIPKICGQQEKATKDSWERTYNGPAAKALWTHIQNHYDPNHGRIYAHFCSVVQSSGMGKSRTIDELGKTHFCVPINLRNASSTGYPPADHEVRNFLTRKETEHQSYRRACCFIDALFEHTNDTLQRKFQPQWGIKKVASEFRILMTAGQTMKEHNEFRREFYRQVVQLAEGKLTAGDKVPGGDGGPGYASSPKSKDYDFPPSASCHKLVELLKADKPDSSLKNEGKSKASQVSGKTKIDYPLIILAFDEAHTLTDLEETGYATWSNFSVLRHVLRALCRFPLFALFLSTTGKISQFTSPDEDTSKRIVNGDLILIQPFTDLGFDTFAKQVKLDGSFNLERVTDDSHIVYMGRPLFGSRYDAGDRSIREDIVKFAAGKLLNADPNTQNLNQDQMLACLSQRLPIQFRSTTYTAQNAERKQVEGHMRVCLKIDTAFQSMETISSSEPLLSEAAYAIMAQDSFDLLKSFKSVLEGFSIDKGDRGEFLPLLLLTLARDQAVGPPDKNGRPNCRFFPLASFVYGHLFSKSLAALALQDLQPDFPQATTHFNHFVKLHDFKSIDKECLLLLIARGAGVLCANNHVPIDAVNVFLHSGTTLTINNLGLILYQIKNDSDYSHIPKPKLFQNMDPYNLGILKAGDAPVPLIRIFFALAAKTPSLHVERHAPSLTYDAIIYDIWSAGLSSEFLKPIDPQTDIWDGLLQASYGWQDTYNAATPVEKELRRSMNPGAADDGSHWSCWAVRDANRRLL